MIGDADDFAKKLLAINPDATDAYVTLGAANYVLGSLPAVKRLYLHFKGIRGDKVKGIQQLEIAAARGRYLRPFAKILLAMAARERRISNVPAFNWPNSLRNSRKILSSKGNWRRSMPFVVPQCRSNTSPTHSHLNFFRTISRPTVVKAIRPSAISVPCGE